jgi:hypothetical protein
MLFINSLPFPLVQKVSQKENPPYNKVFQKQKKDATRKRILSSKYRILSGFEQSLDLFYRRTERFIRFDLVLYRLTGMQDRCMVTLSDDLSDM